MRNLSLVSYRELSTSLTGSPSSYAIDSDRDGAWITCTQHKLHFIDFTSGKVECVTELADHVTSSDVIVGLEYLSEMGVVCIATRNGEVLTYNTATHEVESVGSVSDGISCMGWSPYQDLVVMATGQDNLLLMTKEFDPLTELSMHPHEYGDALPVTVGWGKKETQFHGSLGKPKGSQVGGVTHQVTMGETSWDDGRVRISWKGNGEYFVCSSIDPSTGSQPFIHDEF
jgi:elongator complex protein 1